MFFSEINASNFHATATHNFKWVKFQIRYFTLILTIFYMNMINMMNHNVGSRPMIVLSNIYIYISV